MELHPMNLNWEVKSRKILKALDTASLVWICRRGHPRCFWASQCRVVSAATPSLSRGRQIYAISPSNHAVNHSVWKDQPKMRRIKWKTILLTSMGLLQLNLALTTIGKTAVGILDYFPYYYGKTSVLSALSCVYTIIPFFNQRFHVQVDREYTWNTNCV